LSAPPSEQARPDAVRVLIIDLSALEIRSSGVLQFHRDEHLRWLARAAAKSASLVILQGPDRIELYSTEAEHRRAFGAVIEALSARVFNEPELGRTRTLELSGDAAVRHLFKRVAALEPNGSGDVKLVGQVHAAAALASAATALGPTLGLVFRCAANVGRRIRQETTFGNPQAAAEVRALERLAAERILEEEFAAWQAGASELRRIRLSSNAPPRVSRPFLHDEPGSSLRLRAAKRLVSSGDS
jgi:glutamyl-tRNA reductase